MMIATARVLWLATALGMSQAETAWIPELGMSQA